MHTVKANIRSRNRRQDHQGLQQSPNNLPQVVIKFNMIKGHNKIPTTISRQLYSARKYTNMSLESFSSKLQSCDWQSTLSKKDPTEPYAAFIAELLCGRRPQKWSPILILRGMLVIFLWSWQAEWLAGACAVHTYVHRIS